MAMENDDIDLKPQQERSRRTLACLIQATAMTLMEHGLEGATIPRIAEIADVAPATVYRRFKDKKDLLRVAILQILESSNVANRVMLVKKLTCPSLAEAARKFVEINLLQFRNNGQLMASIKQFLESDDAPDFVKDARRAIGVNVDLVINTLLTYRKEINHPNPERAIRIAVLTASGAIEAFCLSTRSQWATLQPIEDEEVIAELTRGFVAYLTSSA